MRKKAHGTACLDIAIGLHKVTEVVELLSPIAPLIEVEVPGEECPLVGLPGITVDVPILPVHVDITDNGRGSHHIDAHRYVDVVEGEIVQRGATLSEAIDQVL